MSEEQFNPLDVLKRAEDILPSEPTADQRIEVSGYDDWLKNQDIQDPLEGHLGYGDYLREEYVKAEAYNGGIERKIKEELGAALVGKGLLTNENKDEVTSRIDAYGKPDFEKQVRDMVAHTGLEQDDWHNGAAYLAKKDTATPEELESILEQAESSVNRTRNAVLQSKLDSGEIAFARFTSEDGRSYVKAGDAAMQIPMHEALRRSREAGGGVNMADALEIQSTGLLDTPEGMSAPRYKLVQLSELEKLIHAEIKNDPKIAIQVEALGKRMAENDYSSFDHFEEGFRKRVSLPVRKFFENMIGTISDPKPLGTEREEAVDRAMSKDIDETVMEISNKYNKDPDAVRTALQEVVVNNAPMKVFKDESNVGDNIRLDGYGLPYVPAAVKLNDDLFESALEARSDISAATKEALRTERDSFLTTNFVDISKKLTESELSKDWLDHLNKGRKSGLKDRDILSAFTSNPDNRTYADTIFGDLDLGWRDLYRPLTSAFSTVFALGGADWAKEHLKDIAEDNNQRRELAELFGGKLGMAQDLIKLAPEVTVDIGATALLSKFGGRAAATSLAATKAPLYSSMTKKGVLKALTTNAFRRKAGQETADLAENLAAQNLIRNATSKTALDALEAYNKVNLRAITVSSIGLTAANRSAGATYGTVYNQMLKSGASEEDAHDRALGTGMVAGTVTGLITGSFSAFGVGGMEDALLSGMSYRNLKDISNRIIQKADHVSIDGVSDALLQSAIKESAKSVLRKNFFGKGILKAGSAEFAEEALDEFVNTFVTDAGLEQDTPIFDHMKHSLYAGVLGGIMGSAAPVISSAARRVRPDRMREVQEARAYEQRIITDITDRLKEANSEVTADVVKDILEADLYTMPQQEVVTESDIDAETLAETQDAPPETLEEFLSAFNTVSEEDIQEEIESVMGPRLAQMERDVTKEDDQSVFILDEAGEGIVYTNDLVPADKNLTPELSEKLETKPHLLTMDQTLWESYDPEFAALVKDRFKKDKDGKLASPLSEQQQDFVDAKIQEFAAAQRKIVELAAKKGRPIKTPTLGPQPLEDLGLTKEEYFELDRLRMEDRGEVGVVAGTSLGVERIFNTKPVSEQTGDEGIETVTKFQLITKVTYDSNDTAPFVVAPNAERTVSDDGSITDIISRGYFSTKKEAQKEAKNVEDVTGLKAEIVPVSVPVKKRKKVEVGDVEVAKVTEYQVFITKKAEPEVEEEVEEEEEEEAEELAPMPEVGETIKYLPYPNAKELETAEVSQITDEGIILVEDEEMGVEVEVKLSEIVTDKKEAKRAAKTTRKRTKKPKEPKAELVASFGTQEEANQKVEELRKQYTVEQADIEIKPVKKDRTDFSGVTSGGVPVFEEGGLEQRAEAESATHNDMLNRIKELGKKLNDPVKVRDGKKPLLTFKEAREKLIELLDKKNDKEAKAERKEQRDAFEEIEDTYEKAIQQAEFDFEVGDINAALLEIEKKAALTSRYQKLVKLRRNKKAQDLLKEAQKKQAEGTPLLIKGRGNTLREGQIIKDKNGNLQLKPLRGRDKNPITPVDVNGNIYLVTSKIDPITKQKVWHEFGRQDVGANYNTKEKFIQYLKYGPKDAPSKMPWEGLRLSAEESAEVGAIANYGLPPAGLSQTKRFGITKQRKAKGFYPSLNRAITKRIYQLYPVLPVSRPTNGSVITAVDKVTGYSPWAEVTSEKGRVVKGKKRKDPNLFPAQPTSYRPKAFVYKNGVGVFDNDPIAMSVLLGKHPIIIPDSFTGRINKAFRYQRIDGDLVVTDIVGVGANGVAQSMKRKKETTIPFSRVALDKEAGFLGLFKSLSLFRNDKTGKTAEVENPNGAGITTVEDLLNDLNDIIENAGKVNLEEEARLSDRKRIAGMKLGEDATIEDQQNALESIGYSSKRAAAEIERLRQDIRITQDQILIAETREESDRLNEVLSARQGELGVALIEFSNSVIPAAKILAVADENVKDNLDRYTKAEGEVKSLQRRIDELADTEKKINKLGKSGSVSKFVFGIGELKAEIQNDPNNQDLVDRLAALEKEAQANKKYQEYEAARKKYLDLLDDKANKNIADQIANAQERQTLQLEGLHRAVLAKEKVIAGGSVAATRDPFAAKKYLDRILSSRRSGKIEEEFRGDAEAALRTEYELHALMFQLRQDMRPFVDSDGNFIDGEAKANIRKAISILLSRIDHPLIEGETAKKTAKGAIAKEAKQEFAVVLNNLADLGMDNADVNHVEVYRQFIEKLFINGPTYWARGDTLPSFEAVGQRVANNILKQQARRNVRNRNKKLYGQDSIPYPDVEERLSEEERLSGEDKGQSLFFRHFISYDLKQDELLFLIDDLQQDVINILENNPEIRRAFDTLLKEGPFIEMPDFNPAELSAESAWAEMVAYVRQASIGETLGVEGPEGATGAAGVEGGSAVTIDGQLVRRKIATGNVAPLAFLKKLEKGSTPEAQAIKRAFRIYRMADFEFSRDPFKIANPENIAGLKETLADPTVSAEEKSAVTEQLSEVDDALEYTNWLKDEIRYQLAHRVDGNLDLPSELRETILTFQAQNVHKAINEMQARSFFSKSQFAKAIDVAVAGTVNNRNILRLGLDNTSESVLKAMDKIYASEPKEYQRKMARLFGSDQPNAGFVRGVRFQLGLIDNSYASKTEVLADGRIGVTLNAKGWNGRGVTDTLIRSFLHAKLLHNLKSAELTEKQQAAKGKIEATLKALRKKFGGNTQPVMRSGTKSLKDFVDHIFDSSDFQSALKVRLSKKGMPSFDQTLNSLLILTDQRAEVNGDAKFKKSFKDMVDLAGFTYSSPTTPAGVRDEAVTHAGQALAEHDNVHRILGSRLKKQNEEKELSEEDKKELSERANLLAAVAMSRVPAEIEVVMTSIPNGKVAAFDMVSGQLLFDPRNAAIATLERGMDRVSSQGMIGRVIREEMAHKSAKAALTAGMVKAVMDASSDVDYQNDIDAYYGEGTPEAEAAASRLKDPSSEVAFKEKERLVQERLAALTQKIMDGQTTEDAEAFFAANPSTLSIAIFYIKKFINGFIRAFSDGTKGLKPEERIAVNRMLVELRGLEMGYRMPRRMDPKAGPEETALQFLKTVGAEPTEEDDTIKVDKTTLPQEMPSGLESGVGGTFVVEGDEDVAYMEAVEAGDTKTAKEILVKATDKITVDSFRQLAHTVTLQRMGVGSLLRAQQEYDKKQEKLAELATEPTAPTEPTTPVEEAIGVEEVLTPEQKTNLDAVLNGTAQKAAPVVIPKEQVKGKIDTLKGKTFNIRGGSFKFAELSVGFESITGKRTKTEGVFFFGGGRFYVQVEINGVPVTFYQSTGKGGKVLQSGRFYPTMGVGTDKFIQKTGSKDMARFYGSPEMAQVSAFLDAEFGNLSHLLLGDGRVADPDVGVVGTNAKIMSRLSAGRKTYTQAEISKDPRLVLDQMDGIQQKIRAGEPAPAPAPTPKPSKEHAELKKFFDDKDALQQQLFDMWEEKTKVGPKHLEIIVRDKDGNIIPLSQRLGFDVNVTKVEETSQVLEPRVPIQEFDESGAPITGSPKFREELSLSELQSLLENEEEGSDRIPLIESAIERIESEMRDREKTSRPQPDGDALLKMFASELGIKVDATIDKGGVLYSGFGARRRRGDTDFNAFNFDYEQLFSQFEMPVLEVDDLKIEKGFKGLMKKHLVGLLQPEIHHWMKHRQALKKTVATELKMAQVQLRGLIEQVYPDGSVPVDPDGLTIIQKATGSTEGVFLSDAVSARLDKDLNDAKKAAWLNAHTQSQQAGADIKQIQKDQRDAVNAAKAKYESDIKAELVNRRAEIVAERDAARTRIAKDSKELLVALINLRKLADKFTNKLEAIHKESVIKGTTGKYDVKISDNNGIYLTRTYKIFLDVGYADAVRKNPEYQEERDAAIAFFEKTHLENEEGKLRMEHPAKTDAEIKQMAKDNMVGRKIGERALEAFISSYEMKGSGDAYMSAQESIKSMVDNLKAKKNIPKPLRDILGEQKDKTTPDNLLRTIMTVGSMAANQSFLNSIAKAGLDKGWLVTEEEFNSNRDKYVDPETNKEWQRVVQHTSDRQYNPLSGLYGRPELAGAFAETFKEYGTSYANDSEKLMAGSFRYFQKLTGYSMASKTLGSTGFYMRNALSNVLFFGPMQMGGVGNLMLSKDYFTNFVTELKRAHKGDRAKLDDELAKLRSLRIIGDESRTNTMRQLMLGERSLEEVEQDFISRLEDAEGAVGKAKEKAGQGVEYLSRMAAAMDAFFKIAYYKNELKVLEKAYANELSSLSPEDRATRMSQIEKEAASKVLRTTQAYSEAPPLVRALQRSVWGSFLAPFVRFKADVIRVMYNTVKVAMEERASGNAVLIKRGNQRLRGFAFTIGGLSFLVPLLLRMIFGVGEEEDEAYKAAGPKWARHNTLWYRRKKNGELEAWNLTFLNPFSTVMDGVNSAVLGEFFGGGSLDSAIEVGLSAVFVDQFLDDQIFSSALKEAFVKGVDDTTGKRVWIEGVDTGVNKLLKQLHHTWNKGFEPRVWTKMEAAWKASKGDYTELEYSPMGIIFNEFKPVRSRTVKPDQLLKQYIFKMEQARSQIREKFRPLYNKNVSVSEDEIFDIYDEVYEGLKDINKDIIRKMGGFEGLGLSKADIYKISRGTGGGPKMGKRRTELLMNGYMEKPVLSANKVAIMMKEAETDPKMAERLRIFVEAAKRYDRFSKIDD
tara:strand:+ start:1252 stop:15300 length:14049 start_codon:yes stop_codon:yes gene_type:complete